MNLFLNGDMKMKKLLSLSATLFLCLQGFPTQSFGVATTTQRGIQIVEVNFDQSTITLRNFSGSSVSLNGWRFCTHDIDQVRRYSGSTGLNGITLNTDDKLVLYFLNDAPPSDSSAINISALGGSFALPLTSSAYAINLYINGNFGNGVCIADHLQWSIDGIDNTTADERSDEAETGGVWGDQSEWIATKGDTTTILLNDILGSILHSASDYTVGKLTPSTIAARPSLTFDSIIGENYSILSSDSPDGLFTEVLVIVATSVSSTIVDDRDLMNRQFYKVIQIQ